MALDQGPVTLSAAALSIGTPSADGKAVLYRDVATDTDLRYRVGASGLKEEVVLRSDRAPRQFTFHLSDPKGQLGKVTQAPDGGYRFANTLDGDITISLPAASAHDAASASPDVSAARLGVTPAGDGFDLTLSVDTGWLQGKKFPVTVDPTIGFNASNSSVLDGSASNAMSGCGGCGAIDTTGAALSTGSYTDTTKDMEPVRSFLKFDLSQIPSGSAVSSAKLGAYLGTCTGTSWSGAVLNGTYKCNSSHNYTVEIHRMTAAWGVGSTWSTLSSPSTMDPSVITSLAFPAFPPPSESQPTRYDFELTGQTQSWVNSPSTNNGFAMKVAAEPAAIGDASYNIGGPAFESSENGWVYQPTMTVTYTPPPVGPQSVSASAGNASAVVTWAPPTDNGGGAPTGYNVATYTGTGTFLTQTSVPATASSYTATGLTNGSTYKFAVSAVGPGGTGQATFSNVMAVGAQPSVSVTTTSDVPNSSGVMARGQTLTYTVTVTNPGPAALSNVLVTDEPPAGVLLSGKDFTFGFTPAGLPVVQQAGCPADPQPPKPTCTWDGHTVSITGLQAMQPNDKYVFTYGAVAVGSDRGCSSVISVPSAATGANGSRATVPVTVCDSGLGMERWWSYVDRDLGPQSQAHVNPGNGNLVVQATDAAPVQAHGHLSYVLRRTYNSQDSTVLGLPGSIGKGWNLSVGQADDLIGDGVGPSGLYVPPAQSFLNPLVVTMIDRDGTRHVFQPKSLGTATSWVNVSGLAAGVTQGTLIPKVLSVVSGHTLCVDQTYTAPAGVHVSLWRYLDVPGSSCSGGTPTVLGFAAERPDRLRYEFSVDGRLLDMIDGNGVDLRYAYESVPYSGLPPRLTNIYEVRSSCPAGPPGAPTCRAFRFNYSSQPVLNPPAGQPTCDNDPAVGTSAVCVVDPAGRPTKYELDGSGRLVRVINVDGTVVRYSYGSCGGSTASLCSATDLRWLNDQAGGHTSSFSYATPTLGLPRVVSFADRRFTGPNCSPSTSSCTTVTYARPDYVTFDSPGAGRYQNDTVSERTRFVGIDATGRVGEIDEGDTSDQYVRRTLNTWDVAGAACRQPYNVVDNNLCRVLRPSLSNFAADEDTRYTYGAEGQLLIKHQITSPTDVVSTYGYHAQYVPASGQPTQYDDNVQGSGNVSSAGPTTTDRSLANTVFYLSDRTQSLSPRGNTVGASFGPYLTTYHLDNKETVNPNAAPASNTCTNAASPATNTGNTCESDAPTSPGVAVPPATRCAEAGQAFRPTTPFACTLYTYDTYGEKVTMTAPNAVLAAGQPYTYTYYSDSDSDLSSGVSAGGWLKGVTDPTTNFVAFGYDRGGNVFRTWDRNATQGKTLAAYPGTPTVQPGSRVTGYGPYAGGATAESAPWRYLRLDSDPIGNQTTYTVDENGNELAIRPPRGNAAGNANYDTVQTFDNNDNPLSTLPPQERAGNQPDQQDHPTTYTYDPFNNGTSTTDGRGMVVVNRYDRANRLREIAFTRGAGGSTVVPPTCTASAGAAEAPLPAGRIACRVVIGHDAVDNLIGVGDANAQTFYRGYDGVHREIGRTDARNDGTYANTTTMTTYDPDGHPLDACSAREFDTVARESDASNACTASSKLATHNAYDAAGRLSSKTTYRDASHPEKTVMSYDADGNVVSTAAPDYQIDPPNHRPVTDVYDALDRKRSETAPRDANSANDNTTSWTYDAAGNVTAVTKPANSAARITDYAYDADNRVTDEVVGADSTDMTLAGTVDAQGSKSIHTRTLYDPDGHTVATFDPRAFDPGEQGPLPNPAFMVRTDYDFDGRPTASFVPRYDNAATGRHNDLGLTDPSGQNRQTTECPPGPPPITGVPTYPSTVGVCVTRVSYDAAGNRSTLTLPTATGNTSNRRVDFVYTDDNLLLAACTAAPGGSNANGSSCATSGSTQRVTAQSYTYDGDGRALSTTDALGHWHQTAYTSDGLAQDETDINNGSVTHVTHHAYDAAGNEKTVTDPQGNPTATTLFDDNLRKSVTSGNGTEAATTSYVYDGQGNPISVTSPSANAGDANNTARLSTVNTYTADNLLATTVLPFLSDGSQRRRTTYSYFPSGQKQSQHVELVDASLTPIPGKDGGTQRFTWFKDDRQEKQFGKNDPTVSEVITTAYDPAGNKTSVTDSTGGGSTLTSTYFLDDLPRTVGDGSRTTRASYDGAGQRYNRRDDTASTNYPTSYSFNDAGYAISMKADGFPGTGGATTTSFTYDAAGRPSQRTDQNTRITSYTYNPDDTLASMKFANPGTGGATVSQWDYTYRNDFKIASQTFTGYGAIGSGLLTTNETFTYGYDSLGRVNSFKPGTDPARTISYDHDGNRTGDSLKSGTTTYPVVQRFNADDSLASRADQYNTTASPDVPTYLPWGGMYQSQCQTHTYDGFDRLVKQQQCGGAIVQTYDGLDRQRSGDTGDGTGATAIHYDGLSSTVAMETTSAGVDSIYELDPSGAARARAVKSTSPIMEVLNDDGQGNVSTVTDATTVRCTSRFAPSGTPLSTTYADLPFADTACNTSATGASKNNDILYKGERRQLGDGMYQLGSRTYDPRRGTFMSPDSYRADDSANDLSIGTDPLTRNTYSYVNGDPVNLVDPDGHWGRPGWSWGGSSPSAQSAQPERVYVGGGRFVNGPSNWGSMKPRQKERWIAAHSSQADLDAFEHQGGSQGIGDFLSGALESGKHMAVQATEFAVKVQNNPVGTALGEIDSAKKAYKQAGGGSAGVFAAVNTVNPAYMALDSGANAIDAYKRGDYREAGRQAVPAAVGAVGTVGVALGGAGLVGGSAAAPAESLAAEEGGGLSELAGACHSFAPATLVVLADGSRKAISAVAVGDRVRTTDPATGKTVVRTVTALHRNHDTDLADLVVRDGEGRESTLHTTQHHRFWDDSRDMWVEAGGLNVGDRLHTEDGTVATVERLRSFSGLEWMDDLTVDGVHSFYVVAGHESLLVHNCGETFEMRAGDLADPSRLNVQHPINELQLYGGEEVGHGGVANLTNEQLMQFGGPSGDDPITLSRAFGPEDDFSEPGTHFNVEAGHHRIFEIGQRVNAGLMDPETLITVLMGGG